MEPNTVSESLAFSRADKLVIAACAISMLIVQMDWFALNLALPAIGRRFNVPTTDLQWVVSGYMLSIGALMVTAGRLADIYGRRKVIVIGLAIFGIVSAICGSAPDEIWLIVARVVHGIGAALIFPVSIAVVSSTFSGARPSRSHTEPAMAKRSRDNAGAMTSQTKRAASTFGGCALPRNIASGRASPAGHA